MKSTNFELLDLRKKGTVRKIYDDWWQVSDKPRDKFEQFLQWLIPGRPQTCTYMSDSNLGPIVTILAETMTS